MHTRSLTSAALGLALIVGTAACGSSDSDSTPPPIDPGDDPANTAAPADATPGANADVEAYCVAVDEYVAANKKLLADPSSVDSGALAKRAQELITSVAGLAASVSGGDAARLEQCSNTFSQLGD